MDSGTPSKYRPVHVVMRVRADGTRVEQTALVDVFAKREDADEFVEKKIQRGGPFLYWVKTKRLK